MPQLDLMIYFPQFLWFSIGFSLFYIVFLFKIIPIIGFNLKFRKKKLNLINNSINNNNSDFVAVFIDYYFVLNKFLLLSRTYITNLSIALMADSSILLKTISTDMLNKSHKFLLNKLISFYLQTEIKINNK